MHKTPLPLENIIHRTGNNPFALHETILTSKETMALYLHCHPEAEFFLLDEGEVLFHIENQSYRLQAGDAIFVPPNLIHHADRIGTPQMPCRYRAVVFSMELLEQTFTSHKQFFAPLYHNRPGCCYPIYLREPKHQTLIRSLNQILSYRQEPLESCELSISGLLLICWQELYNLLFSALKIPANIENNQANLQKSLDYIWEHFSEPLSLSELAVQSGFSEGYFCHSFKKFTGYSPFEYINRVRIAKSCDLLNETNKKITEIALLCGFNNISYFNRTFHRFIGLSPSAYRKAP